METKMLIFHFICVQCTAFCINSLNKILKCRLTLNFNEYKLVKLGTVAIKFLENWPKILIYLITKNIIHLQDLVLQCQASLRLKDSVKAVSRLCFSSHLVHIGI